MAIVRHVLEDRMEEQFCVVENWWAYHIMGTEEQHYKYLLTDTMVYFVEKKKNSFCYLTGRYEGIYLSI